MTYMTPMTVAATATSTSQFRQATVQRNSTALTIEQIREHVAVVRRRVASGQYLYRAGQPMKAIYLIQSGSLKTCELAEDGREQVTGFRMAGELVGVESIGLPAFACDVVALEDCEVWELPYPPVMSACLRVPELQVRVTAALAEEIRRDRSWMLALGTLSAEQRVAAFLLDLAARYEAIGLGGDRFVLRMSRADMASFLALKHETVSRALSHLADANTIAVQRREMHILDRPGLRRNAGSDPRLH